MMTELTMEHLVGRFVDGLKDWFGDAFDAPDELVTYLAPRATKDYPVWRGFRKELIRRSEPFPGQPDVMVRVYRCGGSRGVAIKCELRESSVMLTHVADPTHREESHCCEPCS